MTSRERMRAALRGEPVDRVPTMHLIKQFCTRQLGIDYRSYNRDHRVLVDAQLRMHDRFALDCFNVMGFAYREANDWGLPLEWPEDSVPRPREALVVERADIGRIRFCEPWTGPLMRDRLEALIQFRRMRPEVYRLGNVEGCWAQAVSLHGMERSLMDLSLDPGLLRQLMDAILPREVAFARTQVDVGADAIMVGDSAASLVSRALYAEVIWPYERELLEAIRGMGAMAKLHICGEITRLLPDIARLPVDMVDVDWMVDLATCRRILGQGICLWGNFDPVAIFLQGTPERVRAECRRCIEESGPRYVLSAGCEVPPDTPAARFAAACEPYPQAATPVRADGSRDGWSS